MPNHTLLDLLIPSPFFQTETFHLPLSPNSHLNPDFQWGLRGCIPWFRLRQHDRIHPPRRRRKPDHLSQKPNARLLAIQKLAVGASTVLSDKLRAPILPRLLSIYNCRIGAEDEVEAGARGGMLCGPAIGITTGSWIRLSHIVKMLARTSLPIRRHEDLRRLGKGEL